VFPLLHREGKGRGVFYTITGKPTIIAKARSQKFSSLIEKGEGGGSSFKKSSGTISPAGAGETLDFIVRGKKGKTISHCLTFWKRGEGDVSHLFSEDHRRKRVLRLAHAGNNQEKRKTVFLPGGGTERKIAKKLVQGDTATDESWEGKRKGRNPLASAIGGEGRTRTFFPPWCTSAEPINRGGKERCNSTNGGKGEKGKGCLLTTFTVKKK